MSSHRMNILEWTWTVYFLTMAVYIGYADGECNEGTAVEFIQIPLAEYYKNFTEIIEDGRRPLGFQKHSVKFNDPSKNPCIKVTDGYLKGLEVMFETIPESTLCYIQTPPGSKECVQGKYYKCGRSSSLIQGTVVFEFYQTAAQGGSESDVNFWLRLTKGYSDDAEAMWCNGIDSDYPSSLEALPNLINPPPPRDEKPIASASLLQPTILLTLLSLIFKLL